MGKMYTTWGKDDNIHTLYITGPDKDGNAPSNTNEAFQKVIGTSISWQERGEAHYQYRDDVEKIVIIGLKDSKSFDIPKRCFRQCNKLKSIETYKHTSEDTPYPGKVATIWEEAFQSADSLKKVIIENEDQSEPLNLYHKTFDFIDVEAAQAKVGIDYVFNLPKANIYLGQESLHISTDIQELTVICNKLSWNSGGNAINIVPVPGEGTQTSEKSTCEIFTINCNEMESHGNIFSGAMHLIINKIIINDCRYLRDLWGNESEIIACPEVDIISSNKEITGFDLGSFKTSKLLLQFGKNVKYANKINLRRDEKLSGMGLTLAVPDTDVLYKNFTWFDHSGQNHSQFTERYIYLFGKDYVEPDLSQPIPYGSQSTIFPCSDTVTLIPDYVLNGVSGVKEIEIGKNIENIGQMAFSNLGQLEKIIYNTSKDLETSFNNKNIWSGNKDQVEFVIGSNVTCLPQYFTYGYNRIQMSSNALKNLSNQTILKTDTFPSEIKLLNGNNIFDLPNSLQRIEYKAFSGGVWIQYNSTADTIYINVDVDISELTHIGKYAFGEECKVQFMNFPKNICEVDKNAFAEKNEVIVPVYTSLLYDTTYEALHTEGESDSIESDLSICAFEDTAGNLICKGFYDQRNVYKNYFYQYKNDYYLETHWETIQDYINAPIYFPENIIGFASCYDYFKDNDNYLYNDYSIIPETDRHLNGLSWDYTYNQGPFTQKTYSFARIKNLQFIGSGAFMRTVYTNGKQYSANIIFDLSKNNTLRYIGDFAFGNRWRMESSFNGPMDKDQYSNWETGLGLYLFPSLDLRLNTKSWENEITLSPYSIVLEGSTCKSVIDNEERKNLNQGALRLYSGLSKDDENFDPVKVLYQWVFMQRRNSNNYQPIYPLACGKYGPNGGLNYKHVNNSRLYCEDLWVDRIAYGTKILEQIGKKDLKYYYCFIPEEVETLLIASATEKTQWHNDGIHTKILFDIDYVAKYQEGAELVVKNSNDEIIPITNDQIITNKEGVYFILFDKNQYPVFSEITIELYTNNNVINSNYGGYWKVDNKLPYDKTEDAYSFILKSENESIAVGSNLFWFDIVYYYFDLDSLKSLPKQELLLIDAYATQNNSNYSNLYPNGIEEWNGTTIDHTKFRKGVRGYLFEGEANLNNIELPFITFPFHESFNESSLDFLYIPDVAYLENTFWNQPTNKEEDDNTSYISLIGSWFGTKDSRDQINDKGEITHHGNAEEHSRNYYFHSTLKDLKVYTTNQGDTKIDNKISCGSANFYYYFSGSNNSEYRSKLSNLVLPNFGADDATIWSSPYLHQNQFIIDKSHLGMDEYDVFLEMKISPKQYYPFQNLLNLILNKPKILPEKAFFGMHSLNSIVLKEGLEEIKKDAFFGCSNLEKLYLPKSLKKMERYSFRNLEGLVYDYPSEKEKHYFRTFKINFYYCGSEQDWINIDFDFDPKQDSTTYGYSLFFGLYSANLPFEWFYWDKNKTEYMSMDRVLNIAPKDGEDYIIYYNIPFSYYPIIRFNFEAPLKASPYPNLIDLEHGIGILEELSFNKLSKDYPINENVFNIPFESGNVIQHYNNLKYISTSATIIPENAFRDIQEGNGVKIIFDSEVTELHENCFLNCYHKIYHTRATGEGIDPSYPFYFLVYANNCGLESYSENCHYYTIQDSNKEDYLAKYCFFNNNNKKNFLLKAYPMGSNVIDLQQFNDLLAVNLNVALDDITKAIDLKIPWLGSCKDASYQLPAFATQLKSWFANQSEIININNLSISNNKENKILFNPNEINKNTIDLFGNSYKNYSVFQGIKINNKLIIGNDFAEPIAAIKHFDDNQESLDIELNISKISKNFLREDENDNFKINNLFLNSPKIIEELSLRAKQIDNLYINRGDEAIIIGQQAFLYPSYIINLSMGKLKNNNIYYNKSLQDWTSKIMFAEANSNPILASKRFYTNVKYDKDGQIINKDIERVLALKELTEDNNQTIGTYILNDYSLCGNYQVNSINYNIDKNEKVYESNNINIRNADGSEYKSLDTQNQTYGLIEIFNGTNIIHDLSNNRFGHFIKPENIETEKISNNKEEEIV